MADLSSKPVGFVKFGSGHPSIVAECSLKDTAEITAAGGTLQTGSTVSSSGVTPGAAGAVKFDFSAISNITSMDRQGQLSFYLDSNSLTAILTTVHTVYGDSTGYDYPAPATHPCWNDVDSGAFPYGRIFRSGALDKIGVQLTTNDTTSAEAVHSAGRVGRVLHVCASWIGGVTKLYIDNVLVVEGARVSYLANQFNYVMLGAVLNGVNPDTSGGVYSNLVLSNTPVMFASHPMLANIGYIGDSFVTQADGSTLYFSDTKRVFDGYFRSLGFESDLLLYDVSGGSIVDSGTTIHTVVPDLVASHPRIAIYGGGTNDVTAGFTDTQVDGALKTEINTILGEADYLILRTVVSHVGSTDAALIDSYNVKINALPAWWDDANPSRAGAVIIVDTFTATGGHNPIASLFQASGNAHPSAEGQYLFAELFAAAVREVIVAS